MGIGIVYGGKFFWGGVSKRNDACPWGEGVKNFLYALHTCVTCSPLTFLVIFGTRCRQFRLSSRSESEMLRASYSAANWRSSLRLATPRPPSTSSTAPPAGPPKSSTATAVRFTLIISSSGVEGGRELYWCNNCKIVSLHSLDSSVCKRARHSRGMPGYNTPVAAD